MAKIASTSRLSKETGLGLGDGNGRSTILESGNQHRLLRVRSDGRLLTSSLDMQWRVSDVLGIRIWVRFPQSADG